MSFKHINEKDRIRWTADEDAKLRSYLQANPDAVFSHMDDFIPGRTGTAARLRAQLLGLVQSDTRRSHASEDEKEQILGYIRDGLHIGGIVCLTGRTHRYIHKLAQRAGLELAIKAVIRKEPKVVKKVKVPHVKSAKVIPLKSIDAKSVARVDPSKNYNLGDHTSKQVIVHEDLSYLTSQKVPNKDSMSYRSSFNRGTPLKKRVISPAIPQDLSHLIADFISKKGVTKPQYDMTTIAENAIRRRGYEVLRKGNGFLIDQHIKISSADDLVHFAKQRGFIAA